MSHSATKKAKKNESQSLELKEALCDIVKKLNILSETDKKLEDLVNYCSGETHKVRTNR
jgi:hypothetical protein